MCRKPKELIKVDRNGTKYWKITEQCCKCGGTGFIKMYAWYEDGVCFECNGVGYFTHVQKEYTPEYAAKLEAKRNKKFAEKCAKQKATWFADHGFTEAGITYLFLGDTYSIKDELKVLGAKFDIQLGWHIDHKVDGYDFVSVNIADIGVEVANGYDITTTRIEFDKMKRIAQNASNPKAYVGEVGKRISLDATLNHISHFDRMTPWGNQTTWIHRFVDNNGNVLVWKSSTLINYKDGNVPNVGDKFILVGTVKEHSEYNEEKQTLLTRCKIA